MTAKVTKHTIYIATCQECGTHVSSSREIMARNSAYKHNIENHSRCESVVTISNHTIDDIQEHRCQLDIGHDTRHRHTVMGADRLEW